jgi:hypothetical protein
LLEQADQRHRIGRLYPRTRQVTGTTHRFWFLLPAFVLVTGIVLTVAAI